MKKKSGFIDAFNVLGTIGLFMVVCFAVGVDYGRRHPKDKPKPKEPEYADTLSFSTGNVVTTSGAVWQMGKKERQEDQTPTETRILIVRRMDGKELLRVSKTRHEGEAWDYFAETRDPAGMAILTGPAARNLWDLATLIDLTTPAPP